MNCSSEYGGLDNILLYTITALAYSSRTDFERCALLQARCKDLRILDLVC